MAQSSSDKPLTEWYIPTLTQTSDTFHDTHGTYVKIENLAVTFMGRTLNVVVGDSNTATVNKLPELKQKMEGYKSEYERLSERLTQLKQALEKQLRGEIIRAAVGKQVNDIEQKIKEFETLQSKAVGELTALMDILSLPQTVVPVSQAAKMPDAAAPTSDIADKFTPPKLHKRKEDKPIHKAVLRGDFDEVKKLLAENPKNAVVKGVSNNTAMHYAAQKDLPEIAEELFKYSAEVVKCSNCNGKQPLHFAAQHGNLIMAKWLVDHGAHPQDQTTKLAYHGIYETATQIATRYNKHAVVDFFKQNDKASHHAAAMDAATQADAEADEDGDHLVIDHHPAKRYHTDSESAHGLVGQHGNGDEFESE